MAELSAKLEDANAALIVAQNKMDAQLNEASTTIAALTEENAALEANVTELTAQLDAAVAELTAKINETTTGLQSMTAAKAEADEQIAALTTENATLNAANEALNEANTALTAANEALTVANEDLAQEKADLQANLDTLTAQLGETNASLAAVSAKLAETTAALEAVNADLAAMAQLKAEADAEIAALNEQKAALTAETEQKAQQIIALSQTLTATENSLTATTDELAATQSNLAESQSVLVSMLSQNALSQGFGGMVKVSAVVNSQGAIAYLTIDASCETAGLGQKVMETEYLVQFLGKTLPLTLGEDVDGIAGATVTSQAVVDALNLLAPDFSNDRGDVPTQSKRSVTKEVAHVQTIQGHDSTMKVVVYTTPNGTVTNVNVYAEGESLGRAVMTNAFTNQFVGYNNEVILGEHVDAIAGATETSQAVVDAVNNIIK